MFQYSFTNLKLLHTDMLKKKEKRAIFPLEYNDKKFSCIFLTDKIPFQLYLTKIGLNPEVFEFDVKTGYLVSLKNEDYYELVKFLELKYDKTHKFLPIDFLKIFNEKVPILFKNEPDYKNVLNIVGQKRIVEDQYKIYFIGWMQNFGDRKVRIENLEKTKIAFGSDISKICKDKNISSRWTDIEKDEDMSKFSGLGTM